MGEDQRGAVSVDVAGGRRGVPARVVAAEVPDMSRLLALQVGVVVVAGLYFACEVLIPIALAILLSFLLVPVVALLRRVYLPRAATTLLSVVLALGLVLAIGGLIGTQVASLASDLPRYATTVQNKFDHYVSSLRATVELCVADARACVAAMPPAEPAVLDAVEGTGASVQ